MRKPSCFLFLTLRSANRKAGAKSVTPGGRGAEQCIGLSPDAVTSMSFHTGIAQFTCAACAACYCSGRGNMRNATRILGLAFFAATTCWRILPALADPGDLLDSTSAEPILPDPEPYKGPAFPASSSTKGSADPGPALESLYTDNRGCEPRNPCAMPSPARSSSSRVGLFSISKQNPVPKRARSDA